MSKPPGAITRINSASGTLQVALHRNQIDQVVDIGQIPPVVAVARDPAVASRLCDLLLRLLHIGLGRKKTMHDKIAIRLQDPRRPSRRGSRERPQFRR